MGRPKKVQSQTDVVDETQVPPEIEEPAAAVESVQKEAEPENTVDITSTFSEPQPSVPVVVVIEPVKKETVELDKEALYKLFYSLGTGKTFGISGVSLVNKMHTLFGLKQEDGIAKWEEIKLFVSKL